MLLFNPKIYLELTVKRLHLQSAVDALRMVSFCQDIADSYGILFIVRLLITTLSFVSLFMAVMTYLPILSMFRIRSTRKSSFL